MEMTAPAPRDSEDAALVARSRALSRALRAARRREDTRALEDRHGTPQGPDVYFDVGPSGWYPIIALRTVPCDLYQAGSCVPCAYSARPALPPMAPEAYRASLLDQVDRFFEAYARDSFVKGSPLRKPGSPASRVDARRPIQIAGQSSFFRDAEIPREARRAILERVLEWQGRLGLRLQVMLESRPEHLVAAAASGELDELAPLLRTLGSVVNIGYEYDDDDLRNVLFDKRLARTDFESAIRAAHARGLDPGAFAFVGGTVLTQTEALDALDRTLRRFAVLDVFPNAMLPNLQSHTIPHLLYDVGHYTLPEPFFLLDVMDRLMAHSRSLATASTDFHWFVGGLETDPPACGTVFDHPRRRTSAATTDDIREVVYATLMSGHRDAYRRAAEALRRHPDHRHHAEALAFRDPRPWKARLAEALTHAEQAMPAYIGTSPARGAAP
jgi:radical SAM enzyme (TIGR01210 family)